MIQLLIVALASAIIGVILALCRARRRMAILSGVALCCLASLVTYWDFLIRDPISWVQNILGGVVDICMALVLFIFVPVLIGYAVTRWGLGRRNSSAQQTK